MNTLNEYGKLERLYDIKSKIENGASFNGTVYGETKGRYINLFVYLSGKKVYFKEVSKDDAAICKQEATDFLTSNIVENVTTKSTEIIKNTKKIEWTINGNTTIESNLGYAEMYDRYGMDFE